MKSYQHLLEKLEPSRYELHLSPNRNAKTFSGKLKLFAELTAPSKVIELHQHGLRITASSISGHRVKAETDDGSDSLRLQGSETYEGNIEVEIEFSGIITDAMNGMYPSTFSHDGKTKQLIGTQFESHHAREVFPCIDEPAAKAVFSLTLDVPNGEQVVSNTPIKESTAMKDYRSITFEDTPIMSTYLLAFVYGEMESLEATSKHGVTVRTWSTPDNIEKTRFALDVGVKSLEFFTDYFDIAYPLEKCDHIALPDFAAGAMENWGCITYRESQMLVDDTETSQIMKQLIAITVAHEVAHQWFGNLVTMKWWTDLWLNEGFASWISVYAIDKLFPEWNLWEDFVADDVIRALSLDSLDNTHAVEVPIDQPEDIRSIFDAISYSKGASLLRMLHGYLGDEDMKKGLRSYMNTYSYMNATTADLWSQIESATEKPVETFMSAWTKQPGFPIVSAIYEEGALSLEQKRFSISGTDYDTTWPIPLYVDDAELARKTADIELNQRPHKLNRSQMGLYFVNYDREWRKAIDSTFAQLPTSDRVGYLYESYKLAQAGYLPTIDVLELISSSKKEENLHVWQNIARIIGNVRFIMDDDVVDTASKNIVGSSSAHVRNLIGMQENDNDSEETLSLRATVLSLAARTEVDEVVDWANQAFEALNSPEDASADLRSVIIGSAVRSGHDSAYDKVLEWYRSTKSAQMKIQLLAALNATQDMEQIQRNLRLITSDDVKLQEVSYWVSFIFSSRVSREPAWQWIQNHWDWLLESFGRDIMTMSSFPLYVGRAFTSYQRADEVEAFFNSVKTTGIDSKVAQALETIRYQAAWRERDYESLLKKLS